MNKGEMLFVILLIILITCITPVGGLVITLFNLLFVSIGKARGWPK